jgi:hypothetical protein
MDEWNRMDSSTTKMPASVEEPPIAEDPPTSEEPATAETPVTSWTLAIAGEPCNNIEKTPATARSQEAGTGS